MTKEHILQFLTAGHAIFTLKSLKTGEHFTYKIRFAPQGLVKFAYLGVGYDEWMYMGVFTDAPHGLRLTARSHFTDTAPSVRALRWFLRHVGDPRVEFKHVGKCARCGRPLTHPDSIDSGIGPECAAKLGAHHGPTRGPSNAPVQHLPPLPRTIQSVGRNFEKQAESAVSARDLLIQKSLEALGKYGDRQLQIHDEILVEVPVGDAHFTKDLKFYETLTTGHFGSVLNVQNWPTPVEQTDCSAAIDKAIAGFKVKS